MKKIIILALVVTAAISHSAKAQSNLFIQLSFSAAVTSDSSVAPITTSVSVFNLVDFAGVWSNKAVVLSWSTQQEVNSASFIVEKSKDGINWQTLNTVAAAGNSNTAEVYFNADAQPFATSYYRLKQVGTDGGSVYSKVLKVKAPTKKVSVK